MWICVCVFALAALAAMAAGAPLEGKAESRECPSCTDFPLPVDGVGPMLGYIQETRKGKLVASFLGLPFAPNPKRFERPEKLAPWTELRDARVRAPMCPQGKFYPSDAWGESRDPNRNPFLDTTEEDWSFSRSRRSDDRDPEDCLTLDVYTPLTAMSGTGSSLPVLFWIHGGAFVRGSSISARPQFLLDQADIVIVAPQYRLGPLGFLAVGGTTGGKGNQALWDQELALQWVVDHVAAFGGDPKRIVVGGVSAGGATSGHLYTSPVTTDHIQAAVLCSGTAVSPWAVDLHPRDSVKGIAKHAGCRSEATALEVVEAQEAVGQATYQKRMEAEDKLRQCLDRVPLEELLNGTFSYARYEKENGRLGLGGTLPVIDGVGGFLPQPPRTLLSQASFKGRPLLIGVTRDEGLYLEVQVDYFYLVATGRREDKELLTHGMGDLLLHFAGINHNLSSVLGYSVEELYWKNDQLGDYDKMVDGVIDFTGAGFFKGPAREMAVINARQKGKSWLYTFNYEATQVRQLAAANNTRPRSNHGHDQVFLFPARTEGFVYSPQDYEVVDRFSHMVANFVTRNDPRDASSQRIHGQPWEPMAHVQDQYMVIGHEWEAKRGWSREYHATNKPSMASCITPALALVSAVALLSTAGRL